MFLNKMVKRKAINTKSKKIGTLKLVRVRSVGRRVLKLLKKVNTNYAVGTGLILLAIVLIASVYGIQQHKLTKGRAETTNQMPIFDSIEPRGGSASRQIFTTTVSDENGGNDIIDVSLWFDTQAPISARTDVSFHANITKSGNQWRYYGWKYIGDQHTCEDGKTGTACWMNYEVTVGGFIPSDDDSSRIYCGGDFSDGTVDTNSRTASWKVRNITVSGNKLVVTWDIQFKPNYPFDSVNMYGHVHDVVGAPYDHIPYWQYKGTWGTRDQTPPNRPPVISSTPANKVKVGQLYRYEILASDPDGDQLIYQTSTILPSWLSMSGNVISGTPSDADIGVYTIVVVVSDGHGHNTPQAFTVTVYKPSVPPPPKPPEPVNDYPTVTIHSPTAQTTFSGTDNLIIWEASDSNGISKINLYYSLNGQVWEELAKDLAGDTTQYKWDVSSLPSGGYFIKVEAFDNSPDNLSGSAVSPEFQINNEPQGDNKPVIRSVQPGDNEITDDTTPTIGATYTSGNVEIDLNSIKLLVDGEEVEATKLATNVSYTPKTPMAPGVHDVSLTIKNAKGETASRSWSFTIIAKVEPQKPTTETKDIIKLPVIGRVSKTLGIILISCTTIGFFVVLVFAIIKLVGAMKGKEEPVGIPQYYTEGEIPLEEGGVQQEPPTEEIPPEIETFSPEEPLPSPQTVSPKQGEIEAFEQPLSPTQPISEPAVSESGETGVPEATTELLEKPQSDILPISDTQSGPGDTLYPKV